MKKLKFNFKKKGSNRKSNSNHNSHYQNNKSSKKRKALRIILVVIISIILLVNALTAITYLILNKTITGMFPHVPNFIFVLYGILALGNVIAMILLLLKRKVGLWVFIVITILTIILNFVGKMNPFLAISGIIGPILIYFLERPFKKELR